MLALHLDFSQRKTSSKYGYNDMHNMHKFSCYFVHIFLFISVIDVIYYHDANMVKNYKQKINIFSIIE